MQHETGSKTLQYTRLAIMFQHKGKAFFFAISGGQCCRMLQFKLKNTAILLAFVSLKLPKKPVGSHVWSVPNGLVTFQKNVVLRYYSNVVLIGVQHTEYSNKIAISRAFGKLFFQLFELFFFGLFVCFFNRLILRNISLQIHPAPPYSNFFGYNYRCNPTRKKSVPM